MCSKWSLNIGWVDLGGINVQIGGTLPAGKTNLAAAQDVANSLPVRGTGLTTEARFHGSPTPKLDLNAGIGVFAYKDERTATIGGVTASNKSSSGKLFTHLGLSYQLTPKVSATAEWERYFLSEDADRLGIGLSYSF